MKKLFLFPCNGNAIEAMDCLAGQYELIGFIDDTIEKQGKEFFGVKVYSRDILAQHPYAMVLAVPGSPVSFMARDQHINSLNIAPERFATLIHLNASVSPLAKIGHNVLIMSGCVITANAVIENHCCILPNTVIHHDSKIGEFSLIGSNVTIAGHVTIEKQCYIGSGSSIINNITIGSKTLIGMGSNVIKSIPAEQKVVGNPARLI